MTLYFEWVCETTGAVWCNTALFNALYSRLLDLATIENGGWDSTSGSEQTSGYQGTIGGLEFYAYAEYHHCKMTGGEITIWYADGTAVRFYN